MGLSGCARFKLQPLSPAEAATNFDLRSLENPALKTFLETILQRTVTEWPIKSWDLEMLTLAAYFYHPSLDVARAQWAEARAMLVTAGGRPNPTVSATPGYNLSAVGGAIPWMPGLNVDLPVETAGKRGHRIAKSRQLAEVTRFNLATTAWQVRSNVRSALLNFNDAGQRERLLTGQFKLQEQLYARLEQRVAAGASAPFEILPAKLALEKLRLDVADLQRLIVEIKVKLADAVGLSMAALERAPALDFSWHSPPETTLTSALARRQALTGRADIRAALAEYEAAQSALQLEIAKQYPDVHLGTGYQWDQGDSKFNLGLSAELPVLNRNQGPIAEAKARRELAAARFTALQARVVAEIDAALKLHRGAQVRLTSLQMLAEQQQKQAAAVDAQVQAGTLDNVDLLAAQIDLATAQMVQWDGTVKAMQALGQLEDALQQPVPGRDGFSATSALVISAQSASARLLADGTNSIPVKAAPVARKNSKDQKK